MPQFNPGTILLLAITVLGAAWAAGLFRPRYEDGRLTLRVFRAGRVVASFALRDTGLLLVLALVMGWAVAVAVERFGWVPDTEGRLVPALALTSVLGWSFVVAGLPRLAYLVASLPAALVSLLLWTPSPLTGPNASFVALSKWVQALPDQTNLLLLIGLLLMFAVTGLWTSWWIFRRRNGLVAILPTGTILAVEIINDTSPGLVFFTVVWLAAAASVLLRLNFVALKEGWRTRRVPHAADTGWTFGEVGIEATVAILAIAFLIVPPLSSADISGVLIPGVVHTDSFHPFGIGSGSGSQAGTTGSVGYSELVRPGSQLTAKPKTVMYVTGDTPTYYPYWRGVALAGWNGIEWYLLPSTADLPVRQQPLLAARATLPRDDLPAVSQRIQILHNTFHVIVPPEQTLGTVFSAGEIISVDNQPTTVRGIMTSVPSPLPGPNAALVNVAGDNSPTASFDTVDKVRLANRLQAPYTYSVTEAVPNVDVQDLQSAGTDYPAWLSPYTTLYQDGRTAQGYSTARDPEIAALAQSIVRGATTPYDQAKAIESWFIEKGRFTYMLKPPTAPRGVRPLDNFLFNTKKGVCQDFSTAMNVMLRMLGVPSRQMSGFSVGVYDDKTRQHYVDAVEAHSWVEVFFPGYGWIPFEPTPDTINSPITRPLTRAQLDNPTAVLPSASARIPPNLRELGGPSGGGSTGTPFVDIWRPVLIGAGGLLLLLIIVALLALRWLLAVRDVPRIWRRLLFLGDRLKVRRHPGDTPEEFGGRLAASVPSLDEEVRRLATLYTRASFRQGGLRAEELAAARRAWTRIRASYPALVARAWRDALRQGRVLREEGAASESRSPSPRR